MESIAQLFTYTRSNLHNILSQVDEADFFVTPDGFFNNLAWNVGHIILATSGLIYARSGLTSPYPVESMGKMYGNGTSPADWSAQPIVSELLAMLIEQPQKLSEDVANGLFNIDSFPTWELRTESITSVQKAATYNTHHEGLHTGVMTSIIDTISASRS